jgi:UDP-galactose transporter B1
MVQSFIASFVALLYIMFKRDGFGQISRRIIMYYSRLSLCSSLASPFGYASLKHIDYPTMVLGKSCKLIPVMLMNIVLHKRRYETYKYFTVLLITAGVSGFMLSEPTAAKPEKSNSLYGLGLLFVNLFLDGAQNSWQDQLFLKFNVKSTQMMFFMNLFSGIMMSIYLVAFPGVREFSEAVQFIQYFPAVLKDVVLFGLCGALGQTFIFHTLESYGSIVLVTITVTRKLFTILISLLWFDHPVNAYQWFFVGIVFFGIILETLFSKAQRSKQKAA